MARKPRKSRRPRRPRSTGYVAAKIRANTARRNGAVAPRGNPAGVVGKRKPAHVRFPERLDGGSAGEWKLEGVRWSGVVKVRTLLDPTGESGPDVAGYAVCYSDPWGRGSWDFHLNFQDGGWVIALDDYPWSCTDEEVGLDDAFSDDEFRRPPYDYATDTYGDSKETSYIRAMDDLERQLNSTRTRNARDNPEFY